MGGAKVEDGPDEEAEIAQPMPASNDTMILAICARLDRMEKKLQDIEDEGDPWLRHLAEYLRTAYAKYFDEKAIKCN